MIKYDFDTYKKNKNSRFNITDLKNELEKDNNMTGWFHLDDELTSYTMNDIINTASKVRKNSNIFLVIGIGGSFLGSKAIIDIFKPYYESNNIEVLFAGTSLSSSYLEDMWSYIKDKDITINVISKSGTTLEPSIAFDYFYEKLSRKYKKDELKDRIIITTDKDIGDLRKLVDKEDFKSFIVPTNIGGRYSVLTPVGLLPIAVAGIDINKLVEGTKNCNINNAIKYALIRSRYYTSGKYIESFTFYEPKLASFGEWLKQLFAETQGKDRKGILPISMINTRDLHSLGQYYQDGLRIIFETVLFVNNTKNLKIKKYNKTLDDINKAALYGVCEAHLKDDVESNVIYIDRLTEENIGELIYFFEIAAATGGYLLNVNPFNQDGVNAYKDLMHKKIEE